MTDQRTRELQARDLDVRDVKVCDGCGGRLTGSDGRSLNAYRVTVDSLIVDPNAARGFHGLTMVVGSLGIAAALSPDTKLLKCFGTDVVVICLDCYASGNLVAFIERKSEHEDADNLSRDVGKNA